MVGRTHGPGLKVELLQPGFGGANEVDDLQVLSETESGKRLERVILLEVKWLFLTIEA